MLYLFLLKNYLVTLPGHKICPDAKAKKKPCTTFTRYLRENAQLWLEHKNLFVYTKNDNAQLSTDDNAAFVGAEQRKGKLRRIAVTTDINIVGTGEWFNKVETLSDSDGCEDAIDFGFVKRSLEILCANR